MAEEYRQLALAARKEILMVNLPLVANRIHSVHGRLFFSFNRFVIPNSTKLR